MDKNKLNTKLTDPIRFALLGYGKIATKRFIPACFNSDVAFINAIGSQRAADLQLVPPLDRGRVIVLDYEELLARGTELADAVYIALPNSLHEEYVIRAATVGLHVLCEKPLVWTKEAAERCVQVCRLNRVLLGEAFMYRHDPRHARVKTLIKKGIIGKVNMIQVCFTYLLEDLANVRLQRELWGGALMDVGCYGIDLCHHLTDMTPIKVRVDAVMGKKSQVDEQTILLLRFPNGLLASIHVSTRLSRENYYIMHGETGRIVVTNAFIPEPSQASDIRIETNGDVRIESFAPVDTFRSEIDAFAVAIRNRVSILPSPFSDVIKNAAVLEKAVNNLYYHS